MAVPDPQAIMLSLLEMHADQREHHPQEIHAPLAARLGLSEADQRERMRSGTRRFDSRANFARLTLREAGLLESARGDRYRITGAGLAVLKRKPARLDLTDLRTRRNEAA